VSAAAVHWPCTSIGAELSVFLVACLARSRSLMEPPDPPPPAGDGAPAKAAPAPPAAAHNPLGDAGLAIAVGVLVLLQIMSHLMKPPSAC